MSNATTPAPTEPLWPKKTNLELALEAQADRIKRDKRFKVYVIVYLALLTVSSLLDSMTFRQIRGVIAENAEHQEAVREVLWGYERYHGKRLENVEDRLKNVEDFIKTSHKPSQEN